MEAKAMGNPQSMRLSKQHPRVWIGEAKPPRVKKVSR